MINRTAYFLDIDNLSGSGRPSSERVQQVLDQFEACCRPCQMDQVYCAGTAVSAYHCADYRPNYRVTVGRGLDGADHRLLELADPDHISRRFRRVVIGSGDGIFTTLALEYKRRGLKVDVILGEGAIASSLKDVVNMTPSGQSSAIQRLTFSAN